MAKKSKYYLIPIDKLLNDPSDYRIFDIRDAVAIDLTAKDLAQIEGSVKVVTEEPHLLIPVQ